MPPDGKFAQTLMISRIGHLQIIVRAPGGADAVAASEALEAAARNAVLSLERELQDEVLIVREIDIPLRAIRRGRARVDWRTQLDEILHRELRRVRARLRSKAGARSAIVADEGAWFVSEGAHLGEAILGELPKAAEWVFAEFHGHELVEVLERATTVVAADAIAIVAARCAPKSGSVPAHGELIRWIEEVALRFASHDPERVLAALLPWYRSRRAGEHDGMTSLGAAEAELPAVARAALAVLRSDPSPMRRLAALAVLFACWPSARVVLTTTPAPRLDPLEESLLRTEAIELLVAAQHAREVLLTVSAAYDEPGSRAARWAIARALAQPRVSPYDPLVLLFSDEDPTVRPSEAVFREIDAEPLHAAAVRAAASLHDGSLRTWSSGDRVYVLAGEICLDYLAASEADAVTQVAQRFIARAGFPPVGITPLHEPPLQDVDLVLAADLPILPDPWRAAVLAFVSVMRAQLHAAGMDLERIAGSSAGLRPVARQRFQLVLPPPTRSLLARYLALPARVGRFTVELEQ